MAFLDFSIAVSALRAHQYAMSVTGHNIANVNTEGYRRQEVVFTSGCPTKGMFTFEGMGSPLLGTGVLVHSIRSMQADFMDNQMRSAHQWLGMWQSKDESLQRIEPLLSEPGDAGLSSVMDKFWNSWQDLAATPESLTGRIGVVESSAALADRIRTLYGNMRTLQAETDNSIVAKVKDVNQLAHEIANLDEQITRSTLGGYQPNDLLDKRDLLVENLAKIVKIESHGIAGAEMIISVGGKALVQGNHVTEIGVAEGPNGWSQPAWSDDNSAALITGGELKGLTDVRDVLIEGYIGSLDEIAQAIVTRVNALHSAGYDLNGNKAGNFFTPGTGASDISVDSDIVNSPDRVAASGIGTSGDNSLANLIIKVRDELLVDGQTVGTAYAALVAKIGSHAKEAASRSEAYDLSLKQLDTQRESVSGVSLDEETINMTKFQQAYNAAARIFTIMDEMIDTVVNRMGTSGR